MEKLFAAFESRNPAELKNAAHPLKSSSQQIGALSFARIMEIVETRAREGNIDGLENLMSDIKSHHQKLEIELQKRVPILT